jgi:NAD(P)-dependent dehydrogenase (short-subunit alcohol dehydrogenase family)
LSAASEAQEAACAYAPAPGSHAGRVVLVTGASDGIGQALALALAAQGATVALLGRSQRKLARTYDRIVAAGHPKPAILQLDLETAAAAEYQALHDALAAEFGRLDGLAHVAGILGDLSPIEQYDVPTWCKVLHVNLTAPFIVTRILLPLLRRSDDASIVFTSSTIARGARAYWGAYAASKFGTEGLMQVVAHEMAATTRIRVNSVNPGPTRTAMRRQAFPAEDPARLPEPAAVLGPYLYLLGPAGRGVNGAAIDCQQARAPRAPTAPSSPLR